MTSGGCTALAMLGAGAHRVTAVDSNPVQNDLADLVAAALTVLDHTDMLRFIGGAPAPASERASLPAGYALSLPRRRGFGGTATAA